MKVGRRRRGRGVRTTRWRWGGYVLLVTAAGGWWAREHHWRRCRQRYLPSPGTVREPGTVRRAPRSLRPTRCASPGTPPHSACPACPWPPRALSHPPSPRGRRGGPRVPAPIPPCAASRHGRCRSDKAARQPLRGSPTGTPAGPSPRAAAAATRRHTHTAADGPSAVQPGGGRGRPHPAPCRAARAWRSSAPPAPHPNPLGCGVGRTGTQFGADGAAAPRRRARRAGADAPGGSNWGRRRAQCRAPLAGGHAGVGAPPPSRSPRGGSTGVADPPDARGATGVNATAGRLRRVQDLGRYGRVLRQPWRGGRGGHRQRGHTRGACEAW